MRRLYYWLHPESLTRLSTTEGWGPLVEVCVTSCVKQEKENMGAFAERCKRNIFCTQQWFHLSLDD